MYDVLKIYAGTVRSIEQLRDPATAQARAIEESRFTDAVYAVQRVGFAAPLYYVWRGAVYDALEALRRVTTPLVPPVLEMTVTPEPEFDEPTTSAPKSKPRRSRKAGPKETKESVD